MFPELDLPVEGIGSRSVECSSAGSDDVDCRMLAAMAQGFAVEVYWVVAKGKAVVVMVVAGRNLLDMEVEGRIAAGLVEVVGSFDRR